MPNFQLTINRCLLLMLLALAIGLFAPISLEAAPASFTQAVNEYKSGNYRKALGQLESYKKAYPNNSLVRYYIALCHQNLGQLGQARTEYEWVSQHGDARLQSLSTAGMSHLSSAKTASTSSTSRWKPPLYHTDQEAGTPPVVLNKVNKAVCIHGDDENWRNFSSSWNSLRSRFGSVEFEELPGGSFGNYEHRYGVTKYDLPAVILLYISDKDRKLPSGQQQLHPLWSMKVHLNEAEIAAAIESRK